MSNQITIGCDPELFVRETATGKFVSAWGMIPGDKHNPHKTKFGAIQVDGMAVEFNINPASTLEQFEDNVDLTMIDLKNALPAGHELVIQPAVTFDRKYFDALPDEAKIVGCDPDYSAYLNRYNDAPNGQSMYTRMAAGHIHIGWLQPDEFKKIDDVDHIADCCEVAKQLDAYVGIPSLLWDRDETRRALYGEAGRIRIKPYGVEYRTPSNMWLETRETKQFVYKATMAAMTDLFDGKAARVQFGDMWAKNAINSGFSLRDAYSYADSLNRFSQAFKTADVRGLYNFLDGRRRAIPTPVSPFAGKKGDWAVVDDHAMGEMLRRQQQEVAFNNAFRARVAVRNDD